METKVEKLMKGVVNYFHCKDQTALRLSNMYHLAMIKAVSEKYLRGEESKERSR